MENKYLTALFVIAVMLMSCTTTGSNNIKNRDFSLVTDEEKYSYTLGVEVGKSLLRDGVSIDVRALSQAVDDVLANRELKLSLHERHEIAQKMQKKYGKEQHKTTKTE